MHYSWLRIKPTGTQTGRAAAIEASKQTGSTKIVLSLTDLKHTFEKEHEQSHAKTQMNLGVSFERQKQLGSQNDFKTDAT